LFQEDMQQEVTALATVEEATCRPITRGGFAPLEKMCCT